MQRYDAFLSYHGSDRDLARQVYGALAASGLHVWFDCESIKPGDIWVKAIEEGISNSKSIVVLITNTAPQRWVDAEVGAAIRRFHSTAQALRIIPLVAQDAPVSLGVMLDAFQRAPLRIENGQLAHECMSLIIDVLKSDTPPSVQQDRLLVAEPYRGWEPFREEHNHLFYGRDEETVHLVTLLANRNRWIQVEGASGSGKSSLVQAGLVPALRRGLGNCADVEWKIVYLRPGLNPVKELATALAKAVEEGGSADRVTHFERILWQDDQAVTNILRVRNDPTLLIVDQFEELFTARDQFPSDSTEVDTRRTGSATYDRFVSLLLSALADVNGPVRLVTTIRSDLAHKITNDKRLATALNSAARFIVPEMGPAQLEMAIVGPLQMAGGKTDSELLVKRLVADAGSGPAGLCLLSHALHALWIKARERGSRNLTFDDYERIGHLWGSVTRSADIVVSTLSPPEQEIARRMLLELVQIGRGGPDVAKTVSKDVLLKAGGIGAQSVLMRLSGGRAEGGKPGDPMPPRLLVVDESDMTSFVHDVLVEQWTTLRDDWLPKARRDLQRRDDMETAASTWVHAERPTPEPGLLPYYDGWEFHQPVLSEQAEDYVSALRKRRVQIRQRRRVSFAALAGLACVLAFLTGVAEVRRRAVLAAQQRQAQQQVTAILEARPEAVAQLVQNLSELRSFADSMLRELASQELEGREEIRVRLALLPVDETQVKHLSAELQHETDPREFATILYALRPHKEQFLHELWLSLEKTEKDAESWLPTVCALANYDPKNPRWQAELSEELVARLVAHNIDEAADWGRLTHPLSAALIDPLYTAAVESEEAQEREIATTLFKALCEGELDKGGLQPGKAMVLIEVALRGSPRQVNTLFPLLQRLPDAKSRLTKELTSTAIRTWNEGEVEESERDAELTTEIQEVGGLLQASFAVVYDMHLEQFRKSVDRLATFGYQLTRVRPYSIGHDVRFAALWLRDGRRREHSLGISREEVDEVRASYEEAGYGVSDIARYLTGTKDTQREAYVVVWEEMDQADISEQALLVAVSEDELIRVATEESRRESYQQRPLAALSSLVGGDGSVSFSALFSKHSMVREFKWGLLVGGQAAISASLPKWGYCLELSVTPTTDGADSELGGEPVGHACVVTDAEFEGHVELAVPSEQHDVACGRLGGEGYRPLALDVRVLDGKPVVSSSWYRPAIGNVEMDTLANRQAHAIILLYKLGHTDAVWHSLGQASNPGLQAFVTHMLQEYGVPYTEIIRRLRVEADDVVRRALLIALGDYDHSTIPLEEREQIAGELARLYRDDSDPGIHSAVERVLGNWKFEVPAVEKEMPRELPERSPTWFRTSEGHTMISFQGPVEFIMGLPAHEAEQSLGNYQHHRRIDRSFAVASKEVTLRQYVELMLDHSFRTEFGAGPEGPVIEVAWLEAIKYCNRLSQAEGIAENQWCYVQSDDSGSILVPADDFLSREGYRLPTEAEWEYVCRGGSPTWRSFGGASNALLSRYGWFLGNSIDRCEKVGLLAPNQYGFFDLYGNVSEWCSDIFAPYPIGHGFVEDTKNVVLPSGMTRSTTFVVRGGSFRDSHRLVHSTMRFPRLLIARYPYIGFRVARTLRESSD